MSLGFSLRSYMGINLLNSEDLRENKFGEDFMLFLF